LVASVSFMRLSSWKGAHAALSSAAWQEIRVRALSSHADSKALIAAAFYGTAKAVPFVQTFSAAFKGGTVFNQLRT
jgi:hypothetical protein